MARRETSAEIDAAAALWAVRADSADFGEPEEAELMDWLSADSRRWGAYARACAMLAQADRVKALGPTFDPDSYGGQYGSGGMSAAGIDSGAAVPVTRRRLLAGGAAAAAAGIVAAVGLSWPAAATVYSTRRGEIRLIPLTDGSSMTLNTQTTAKVRFSAHERHIELVEGEALFDVTRDAARPFIVEAGASRVKAAATLFTVSRLPEQAVKVMVRQGSVELTGSASSPPAVLTANTRAFIAADTAQVATIPVPPSQMDRDLAWQQGMLSFEDEPLSAAARQFARYSDTAIRFDDPAIGNETVTGLYSANNPQGFARSVALSLGLRANEQPGVVTLSR